MKKAKAKAVPFGGALNTFEHLNDVDLPTYLPKKGQDIITGERFEEEPMSSIAAAKIIKAALGNDYNPFHLGYVKKHFPEGVTPTALDALIDQFKQIKNEGGLHDVSGG